MVKPGDTVRIIGTSFVGKVLRKIGKTSVDVQVPGQRMLFLTGVHEIEPFPGKSKAE